MMIFLVLGFIIFLLTPKPVVASNNPFGIHIITPTDSEIKNAAGLVNSSGGDWGYVTLVIQKNDRDPAKWQNVFNLLRRRHLIPIIRIATVPIDDYWEMPAALDAEVWADFLGKLVWPTKTRYVVVYNEPNHAKEWGNTADPFSYARILDQTLTALKANSPNFFVLNAGFDASSPQKPPEFYDEEKFLVEMEAAVPGIFRKLDGWASHSYPNPGFRGDPGDRGRGTVKGYEWELDVIKRLGGRDGLPVFITETGWEHAEGVDLNVGLPTADRLASYYEITFNEWASDSRVVAVTPFILDYPQPPFDHFSFKKVLGAESEFYPHYEKIVSLKKNAGRPPQEFGARPENNFKELSLTEGKVYKLAAKFLNTGQSIWGERGKIKLSALSDNQVEVKVSEVEAGVRVEPGESYDFEISILPKRTGKFRLGLAMDLQENGAMLLEGEVQSSFLHNLKQFLLR